MKPIKRDRPVRNTGADCERCAWMRKEGANYCAGCGKLVAKDFARKTILASVQEVKVVQSFTELALLLGTHHWIAFEGASTEQGSLIMVGRIK